MNKRWRAKRIKNFAQMNIYFFPYGKIYSNKNPSHICKYTNNTINKMIVIRKRLFMFTHTHTHTREVSSRRTSALTNSTQYKMKTFVYICIRAFIGYICYIQLLNVRQVN